MNSFFRARTFVLSVMIVLAAFSRLLPHPPNFAPITAMALFGAAYFDRRWLTFLVPIAAMLLSDLALEVLYWNGLSASWGVHPLMGVVYGTFAVIAGLGLWLRRRARPLVLLCAAPVGSLLFFVVTNFAVWAFTADQPFPEGYAKTWAGLLECYTMALPFFHWTLLGDLAYSTVLFGGWALLTWNVPALSEPLPA
jgi:hypothetical protein